MGMLHGMLDVYIKALKSPEDKDQFQPQEAISQTDNLKN
jgi:hypothetical protein